MGTLRHLKVTQLNFLKGFILRGRLKGCRVVLRKYLPYDYAEGPQVAPEVDRGALALLNRFRTNVVLCARHALLEIVLEQRLQIQIRLDFRKLGLLNEFLRLVYLDNSSEISEHQVELLVQQHIGWL